MGQFEYTYHFNLKNGANKSFNVIIDDDTLEIKNNNATEKPEWAELEKFKCPHCPLNMEQNKYCPAALSLNHILDEFSAIPSYELAEVTVESKHRKYQKDSTAQGGLSSLMGLLMVSSGCPILGKLKPMIKNHLPFASIDETEYRVFSTYLLAQFIKMKRGETPDWEMKGLRKIYEDINLLNKSVASKILNLEKLDANVNAVVILNNFADSVTMSLEDEDFWQVEPYFKEFL